MFFPTERLRQSAAEIVAAAVIDLFPATLCIGGGPTESGFFYDFIAPVHIDSEFLVLLEEKIRGMVKGALEVKQIEMMRKNGAEYLRHLGQPLVASQVERGSDTTVLLCQIGKFCDACSGPLVAHTGEAGEIKLLSVEQVVEEVPGKGEMTVTRIEGIVASDKQVLKRCLKARTAGAHADYRAIGKEMRLFTHLGLLSDRGWSWHGNGAVLRDLLTHFWVEEHRKEGFTSVSSPHLVKKSYQENFDSLSLRPTHGLDLEGGRYALATSFLPGHAALFQAQLHSYRELPVRLAEIGPVSLEDKGSAVKGMRQIDSVIGDEAHLFCSSAQLEQELISSLQFIDKIIKMFGFEFQWHFAWKECEIGKKARGDGAAGVFFSVFSRYGVEGLPSAGRCKDTQAAAHAILVDRFGREWRGPSLALDCEMPRRLGLKFQGADDKMHTPLLLKRVLFGSLERWIALLLEHFEGDLPLWLSPEQVRLIPIGEAHRSTAEEAMKGLRASGLRVGCDTRSDMPLGKRVREAELERIPYIAVMGDKETEKETLAIRECRKAGKQTNVDLQQLIAMLREEVELKAIRKGS